MNNREVRRIAEVLRLSDVQPQPVRWLWPGRIPLGKLTLIYGDPGLGKSLVTLDIAARVSSGAAWPDDLDGANSHGGVVLLSAEDDIADTIRPRLDAAGANPERIIAIKAVRETDDEGREREAWFNLAEHLPCLEAAIDAVPSCRLVVIDPISAFLGETDSHTNAEVRAVLGPLAELAARKNVAIVCITHLRKGDGSAIHRSMGSVAFIATARAAWVVSKDRGDETGRRRLFLPAKCNLAPDHGGLAYRIAQGEHGGIVVGWEPDPVTVSADDALAPPPRKPGPEPAERTDAETWLRGALENGPRPSVEVTDEAKHGEGLSQRTLIRARLAVGVVAYRPQIPGPWWWRLPDQQRQAPTVEEPGDLGTVGARGQKRGFSGGQECQDSKSAKFPECGAGDDERPPLPGLDDPDVAAALRRDAGLPDDDLPDGDGHDGNVAGGNGRADRTAWARR